MTFMNKKAFSTRDTLRVKSSYLDRLLGKKEKIIDNYVDRDIAQAAVNKADAERFLERVMEGDSGIDSYSIPTSSKKARDTILRSDKILRREDEDAGRLFYSGAAKDDIKNTRINTALGVGAAVGSLALAKKLLSKKKPLPKETILNKINPYAAGAAGLGTIGLGTLYMNKTAENQEYEADEVPSIDPKEEVYEERAPENFSVKRNPLRKKIKKKLKKESIPKKEDLEFKNDLDDDDPGDRMSEKVSSINFYTSITNQTEKTAGRARKIRKLNKELSALLDKDEAFSKKVRDASEDLKRTQSKIKEKDTFFGRMFNSKEVTDLKKKELDDMIRLDNVKGEAQRAAPINKIERDSINTRLQMFRHGDEVGKSFRKSKDLYNSAAKEIRDSYGSPIQPLIPPRNISELNKKNKASLGTYERLSKKLSLNTPMDPKRLSKIDSRVKSSVGETNKLLSEGKQLRKKFNQQEQDLFNADQSRKPKWISRRLKNQKKDTRSFGQFVSDLIFNKNK